MWEYWSFIKSDGKVVHQEISRGKYKKWQIKNKEMSLITAFVG